MKIKTVKLIDKYVGTILVFLLWLVDIFRKKSKEKNKILIIMLWGIGSNITALPAINALKKKFPKAEITILAPEKNKDLFYKNRHIDRLLFVDLSFFPLIGLLLKIWNKFDLVIDTEHWLNISAIISFIAGKRRIGFSNRLRALLYTDKIAFEKNIHSVENNLNLARIAGADLKQKTLGKILTKDIDKKYANDFLRKNKINKRDFVIGICPGSGPTVKERRWPKEKFAELADILINKHKAKVILAGSNEEKDLVDDTAGLMKNGAAKATDFSLSQLIALIDNCKLFISNDTGPMHIAAAQGIKTIGLFGPETPAIFAPYGEENISIFKKIECSPCIRIYEGRHIKCYNEHKCMRLISVKEVLKSVEKLIS